MTRYLRIPKSVARKLGVPTGSTVAVQQVPNNSNDSPSGAPHAPNERLYVVSLEGNKVGFVYSLSGWQLGKHP